MRPEETKTIYLYMRIVVLITNKISDLSKPSTTFM